MRQIFTIIKQALNRYFDNQIRLRVARARALGH
jgi:hypothetical protein